VCLRLIRRDAHCVIGQKTNDIPHELFIHIRAVFLIYRAVSRHNARIEIYSPSLDNVWASAVLNSSSHCLTSDDVRGENEYEAITCMLVAIYLLSD
jgi:hypothetical protein